MYEWFERILKFQSPNLPIVVLSIKATKKGLKIPNSTQKHQIENWKFQNFQQNPNHKRTHFSHQKFC